MKHCNSCGTTKALGDFHKETRTRDGLNSQCKECVRTKQRAWTARNRERYRKRYREYARDNPEIVRRAYLKHRFGLTPEDYDAMLEAQGGACGVCGQPPKRNRLAVDHDHTTGQVRGLLCLSCNTSLGIYEKIMADPRYIQYLDARRKVA